MIQQRLLHPYLVMSVLLVILLEYSLEFRAVSSAIGSKCMGDAAFTTEKNMIPLRLILFGNFCLDSVQKKDMKNPEISKLYYNASSFGF